MCFQVMVVYGTRPEAIKLAPVIRALDEDEQFNPIVVVTAQHREMLDQVNEVFDIVPDVDLNMMTGGQTLNQITSNVVSGIDAVIERFSPDAVLVQGDTSTVMAAALAAFNREIPVIHLEAGLRSGSIDSPFPEEGNRKLVSQIASVHLAPTEVSRANLRKDGVHEDQIHVVGNTVIDALHWAVTQPIDSRSSAPLRLGSGLSRVLLVTTHRRENLGERMTAIGKAMARLAKANANLVIVWPAHKNPRVRESIAPHIQGIDNIVAIEPLGYADFCYVLSRSDIVLTDSGGIQEEAPSLGKPVLVLRSNTERPEAVDAGTVKLIGTDEDRIVAEVSNLLDDEAAYESMARAINPYGDGASAGRVLDVMRKVFRQKK